MYFHKGDVHYSVIRTNDAMSDGTPIFKVTAWESRGQMIGVEEIVANSAKEVKDRILNA